MDCGTPYIDCTNTNESAESLFKRLISIDDDGNLTLNICCNMSYLQLTPSESPPEAATEGAIYYDTDGHFYGYDGTNWLQLDNESVE